MAFQLSGFQANAFQIRRPDQRRPGGFIDHKIESARFRKKPTRNDDDEVMQILRHFVENVLH